jgi:hypothetical protein
MPGVRDRKRRMVSGLNTYTLENYRKTGAEFILGTGRFITPRIGFSASSAALADVNGNAKPDLLEANESSNSVGAFGEWLWSGRSMSAKNTSSAVTQVVH